jgi:hypothetical protein
MAKKKTLNELLRKRLGIKPTLGYLLRKRLAK